eukprot:Polyplicarium_translucidae@DN2739_c0_g1_i2.p6
MLPVAARAQFNLGFMHEWGKGAAQDFELARRYYESASTVDSDARVPSSVALAMLSAHRLAVRLWAWRPAAADLSVVGLITSATCALLACAARGAYGPERHQ